MVYLKQIIQTDIGDQDTQYEDDEGFRYVLTLVSIATALTFMNYLGLEIVGNMSLVIAAISLSPFLIMCIFGMFKIKPSRLMVMSSPDSSTFFFDDDNGVDGDDGEGVWGLKSSIIHIPNVFNVMWRPFLNNIFWNVNSFDSAANLSKEVKNLKECFTRGMLQAIIFCALSYLLPLIVALGAVETKQEDWVDGYIATVAIDIVGKWLGQWMVVAAGISNIGLFIAELSADSYQLMGMAEKGLWPKIFAHRSRFDTPTYSILLCYFVILSLLFNDYNELLAIMNFNYAISLIMEYAAFIKLRLRKHDREYLTPIFHFVSELHHIHTLNFSLPSFSQRSSTFSCPVKYIRLHSHACTWSANDACYVLIIELSYFNIQYRLSNTWTCNIFPSKCC